MQIKNGYIFCGCGLIYKNEDPNLKFYDCRNCKDEFCVSCKVSKRDHAGKCGFNDIVNSLDPENWPILEGKKLRQVICLGCLSIWSKADEAGCDHMVCPKCKTHFNYCCMTWRDPCTEHGIHYHRPSCVHLTD